MSIPSFTLWDLRRVVKVEVLLQERDLQFTLDDGTQLTDFNRGVRQWFVGTDFMGIEVIVGMLQAITRFHFEHEGSRPAGAPTTWVRTEIAFLPEDK